MNRSADDARDVVVGVDIGTTAVKAAAYDRNGDVHAHADREYGLDSPQPDRAEQDPDVVTEAVTDALAEVVAATRQRGTRVAAVAFSAAMHSLLALDRDDAPLTGAITFADNRATAQAERLRRDLAGLDIYQRTGTPIHPMSPLTKLLWFADHEPDLLDRAARWMSLKEYVLLRLSGQFVVDHSIASATGLFNIHELDWDDAALELVGVPRAQLSEIVPTTHTLDGWDAVVAERVGLDRATPLVVGANDGVLANLGVGAVTPDIAACTIGTSGAVRVVTDRPRTDPEGRLFCYALTEQLWVIGGAINNGGIVLRWVRDELLADVTADAQARGEDPYVALGRLAEQVPAGAGGLVFLPYLTGERAPHWSSLPRALLFGLRRQHRRGHLVRAVLEGITYQLYSVARLLEASGVAPTAYRATGGFAHSPLWCQIMADVFGSAIAIPERSEGSAFGAALLGMRAVGLLDSLDAARDIIRIEKVIEPDADRHRVYAQLEAMFERLYDRVQPEFAELAELQTALLSQEQQQDAAAADAADAGPDDVEAPHSTEVKTPET